MSLVSRDQIDEQEAAEALEATDGNISKAAKALHVDSARLRLFVERSERLRGVIGETFERAVDDAIAVLFEGLQSDSFLNRFYAAKEFLRSDAGRRRGFGRPESPVAALELKTNEGGAKIITLKWLTPPEEGAP